MDGWPVGFPFAPLLWGIHTHNKNIQISSSKLLRLTIFRNAYYHPHTHNGLTTHLIRRGTFTVSYPEDPTGSEKETFGPGSRIDVPAGKVHEVWIGEEGCEYVIGE